MATPNPMMTLRPRATSMMIIEPDSSLVDSQATVTISLPPRVLFAAPLLMNGVASMNWKGSST